MDSSSLELAYCIELGRLTIGEKGVIITMSFLEMIKKSYWEKEAIEAKAHLSALRSKEEELPYPLTREEIIHYNELRRIIELAETWKEISEKNTKNNTRAVFTIVFCFSLVAIIIYWLITATSWDG